MPNTNLPSEQEQFKQVLTDLADKSLIEYFTDDAQLNQLVDWMYEETRVPKLAIRLTLKKVIPFVLNKSNELAGETIKGWWRKLHDRLSEYSWYLYFCTTVLNVLKSKTDQTYAQAVDIPSAESLTQLLNDPARWENLEDDQKALIQLLFGQRQIQQLLNEHAQSAQTGLQSIRQVTDQILKALQYRITLDTPEDKTQNHQQGVNASWLTYTQRQISLLARDSELKWLDRFLDSDNPFAWCVITGAGGSGKSRLALESLLAHQNHWECGFVSSDELRTNQLKQWQPDCPMYMVIDYAATYPDSVRQWLSYCAKHQHTFDYPVRMVLLERAADGQQWWQQLLHTGKSEDQSLRNALYRAPSGDETVQLDLFDRATQQTALQQFLSKLESPCADKLPHDEAWCQRIDALSNKGTPLFIGLIALAIQQNGDVLKIRAWDRIQLLNEILDHERTHWRNTLNDIRNGQSSFSDDEAYQLLALSCMVGGVQQRNRIESLLRHAGLTIPATAAAPILRRLSNDAKYRLQPDLFAEYFVLKLAQEMVSKGFEGDFAPLLHAAHQLAPNELYEFIQRCAVDYPSDKNSFTWWSALEGQTTEIEEPNSALIELAFDIIGQLRLVGRYTDAEKPWLEALLAQQLSDVTHARALNMQGLVCLDRGDYATALRYLEESKTIHEEIGDRAGLGATLNNISQIYKARGDYTTALRYLEESKTIHEEIGDRAGLGATLNNISQIYDARGDYATALRYLEESKTIQEAIGDRAGLGATLNNISQIYKARGDYTTALRYLEESKTIHEEIGDRAGLGATLNNISAIYQARGDYTTALRYLEESKTICEEIGDRAGLGVTLFNLGHIAIQNEQSEEAVSYWAQAYVIAQAIGYQEVLDSIGSIEPRLGAVRGRGFIGLGAMGRTIDGG